MNGTQKWSLNTGEMNGQSLNIGFTVILSIRILKTLLNCILYVQIYVTHDFYKSTNMLNNRDKDSCLCAPVFLFDCNNHG